MSNSNGVCETCGRGTTSVTGADGTKQVCFICVGKRQITKEAPPAFDPGEDWQPGMGKVATKAAPVKPSVVKSTGSFKDMVMQAVGILQALPMPKDIGQFKKVAKVIKTLESLVEEQ